MRIENNYFIFLLYTFLYYNKCFVYSRPDQPLKSQSPVNLNSHGNENDLLSKIHNPNDPETELTPKLVEVVTADDLRTEFKVNDTRYYYIEDHPRSFYVRFNFKKSCVEVKYAGKTVWEEGKEFENETPNEVFFEKKKKSIGVDFPSFYAVYQYKNNQWVMKSFSRKSIYATGLNIYTVDENGTNLRENDNTKYDVYKYDFVVHYEIKDDAKCVEVRCKNKVVWKYDPENHGKGFPKSVYLHTDFGLIFMDFDEVSSIFRCAGNTCRVLANRSMKGFSYSSVKVLTEDPKDPKKLKENDPTQYRKKCVGYAQIYNLREGSKCKELKYDDNVLWYYGYKSKSEYPKSVFVNFYFKMIVIQFSQFNMVYMYLDRWRYLYKSYPEPFTENEVSIFTQNDSNKSRWDLNDKSKYEVTKYPHDYALMFNFKPKAKCTQLKFKRKTIWTHDPRKFGQHYPNLVYLNRDLKMILLSSPKFFNIYVKLDKWREVLSSKEKDILESKEEEEQPEPEQPAEDTTPTTVTPTVAEEEAKIKEPRLAPRTRRHRKVSESESSESESSDSESSDESDSETSDSESSSSGSETETSASSSSSESSSGEESDSEKRVKTKRSKRKTKRSRDTRDLNKVKLSKKTKKERTEETSGHVSEQETSTPTPEQQPMPFKSGKTPQLVRIPGNEDDEEEIAKETSKKSAKSSAVLSERRRKIITTTFVVIIICLLLVLAGVGLAVYLKKRKAKETLPLLPTELEV